MTGDRSDEQADPWEVANVPSHPIRNGQWVAIVVDIRDNASGEIRSYEYYAILNCGEHVPGDYIWRDGNYSCDCNRGLFFARAGMDDEKWDRECSEGLYSVRVKNKMTGRAFYDEINAGDGQSSVRESAMTDGGVK